MSCLRICPGCSRHVRSTETACPFCAGSLEGAVCASNATSGRVLGRAALLFAGAAAVGACGKTQGTNPTQVAVPPYSVAIPNEPLPVEAPDAQAPVAAPTPDAGADAAKPPKR